MILRPALWVRALPLFALCAAQAAVAVSVPIAGVSQSADANPLRTIEAVSFSPSGQQLLVVGNLTSAGAVDYAYTVPLAGGTPNKVSDGTADVEYAAYFTPDGSEVVYAADAGDFNNLYRVPATGGVSTSVTTERVTHFRLTPDGQTAVFLTRPTGAVPDVLRSVPLTGGAVTTLSTATQGDIDRASWGISPDSQTVVFGASFLIPTSANEDSLFRVPVNGSAAPTLINFGPVAPHQIDIEDVAVSADGRVAFIADYTVNNNYNLHFSPLNGGTAQLLPSFLLPAGSDMHNFVISPDGRYVAFSADLETVNVFELFVVPIAGGAAIKVSDPMTAEAIDLDITGDGVPDISDGEVDGDILDSEASIAWSPNGSQIAYVADGELDGVFSVYLVSNPLFEAPVGDYNGDGFVDAADYTVWRDTLGSISDLRADGDGSLAIDAGDYQVWKNGFGPAAGVAGSVAAIPEPPSASCLALALLFATPAGGQRHALTLRRRIA
ncbi:translocation protein TolB [Pirellulimonas nuda]|uniref:Translocation protein TolB n=1 Tax=Pirellulimonas nuda TaxID=2528009 RepID=A0A518DCL5_9BACT|nr:PD40 domain-containing protein [Pirellulimonas nuda]QDU89222.1 translocation protein TolB [Pirellulimonas nuda]